MRPWTFPAVSLAAKIEGRVALLGQFFVNPLPDPQMLLPQQVTVTVAEAALRPRTAAAEDIRAVRTLDARATDVATTEGRRTDATAKIRARVMAPRVSLA
jgi:hypothetical protein